MNVRVIGLDGSLQNFGMAVCTVNLDEKKIVSVDKLVLSKTKKDNTKGVKRSSDDVARFRQHSDLIKQTIDEYNVSFAIGEVPSGAKDARAAFAFGGVTALLASLPVRLVEVTPTDVKVASTGFKHADKEDIIEWAVNEFPDAGWIMGSKPNKMNIMIYGKYVTNANEHLADSVAAVQAGLNK